MTLPTPFTTASPILASYSYTDVADGTGVLVLYGYSHKENTTIGYALSSSAVYPETLYTKASTTGTSFVIVSEGDFDLTAFNLPRTIKGTATIQATIGALTTGTASSGGEVYLIVKLRKWDGTTETEIANAQSSTVAFVSQTEKWETVNFHIIVPETQFADGETLRATAEVWAKRVNDNDREVALYHDPKNTAKPTGSQTGAFQINIPFKLDL